jgi:hypothetical protein
MTTRTKIQTLICHFTISFTRLYNLSVDCDVENDSSVPLIGFNLIAQIKCFNLIANVHLQIVICKCVKMKKELLRDRRTQTGDRLGKTFEIVVSLLR